MSKTWDFLEVKRPVKLPCTIVVNCESSVVGMSATAEFERGGNLFFVIGPAFIGAPLVERKLTFSYEEFPELDYKHDLAGEIEVGKLSREKKKIYLFLEK